VVSAEFAVGRPSLRRVSSRRPSAGSRRGPHPTAIRASTIERPAPERPRRPPAKNRMVRADPSVERTRRRPSEPGTGPGPARGQGDHAIAAATPSRRVGRGSTSAGRSRPATDDRRGDAAATARVEGRHAAACGVSSTRQAPEASRPRPSVARRRLPRDRMPSDGLSRESRKVQPQPGRQPAKTARIESDPAATAVSAVRRSTGCCAFPGAPTTGEPANRLAPIEARRARGPRRTPSASPRSQSEGDPLARALRGKAVNYMAATLARHQGDDCQRGRFG